MSTEAAMSAPGQHSGEMTDSEGHHVAEVEKHHESHDVARNDVPDPIEPLPISRDEEDIYGAPDDLYEEKKLPPVVADEADLKDSKKKKVAFEDAHDEEAPPPPYAPPVEQPVKKPFWKRRWFLLAVLGALALLIVVVGVALGVTLSKKHNNGTPSNSGSGNSGSSPTSPSPNPSSPSGSPHGGDAGPPRLSTALSGVAIQDLHSPSTTPLVQMFFQDEDLYLCSKTSTSSISSWPLSNSGSRIQLALNATPIVAVHQPDFQTPTRVFFINADGFLADIYQPTWGGAWNNGSLVDRQFKAGAQFFGNTYNSLGAAWCSGDYATVFAMGTDLKIYGFKASGEDSQGNGAIWNIVWTSTWFFVNDAVNIAAVCGLSIAPAPPALIVNKFDGISETGQLISVINGTNATIPLPAEVASLFRPNSPIAAVYSQFAAAPDAPPNTYNNTMFLFFPLPETLNSLTPNPSIHTLSAEPYWSASKTLGDSVVATMYSFNWTGTVSDDTGVVPYARGGAAIFGGELTPDNLVVDEGLDQSMPRAWTPIVVGGGDGQPEAVAALLYQDEEGAVRLTEVIGGEGSYVVIPAAGKS